MGEKAENKRREVFVLEGLMSEDSHNILTKKNWWEIQTGTMLMSVAYMNPRSNMQAVMRLMVALLWPFTPIISIMAMALP